MNSLLNAIAKTATPTALAELLNCLSSSETNSNLTNAECIAAEEAIAALGSVLRDNVGDKEANRMLCLV